MMKRVGVAILGVGVVGGGTFKTLVDHREFYKTTQNVDIVVESVLDNNKERALSIGVPEEILAGNIAEVVANPAVDIVIETIGGCGVAKDFIRTSWKRSQNATVADCITKRAVLAACRLSVRFWTAYKPTISRL